MRPDTVIAFSTAQWWALKDAGYRIPEDLGFVSLHVHFRNNTSFDEHAGIAGLSQRTDPIARQSGILLDQLIRHNEQGFPKMPQQTLILPQWHMAGSLLDKCGTVNAS